MNGTAEKVKKSFAYISAIAVFFIIISLSFSVLFFPYNWAYSFCWFKTIVWRILISAILVFFVSGIIYKKISPEKIEKTKKFLAPLFFLVLFLLLIFFAAFFSVDRELSFWGSPLRAGGVVNLTFYFIFSLLCFFIVKGKDWKKILIFAVLVGFCVAICAVFQNFSLFGNFLISDDYRPASTIGNPNFLSYYLLLLFFICPILAFSFKHLAKKAFFLLLALFFLFVIVFITQTRAAFLAIFIGLFWMFLFYLNRKAKLVLFLAIGLILLSFLYLDRNFDKFFSNQPILIKSPIGRILSLVSAPSEIIKGRLSAWKISLKAFENKPIFGFGPENYEIAFNKYYDSSLPALGNGIDGENSINERWDRAHNFIFDISVTSGIFALLFYILFFLILLKELGKIKSFESRCLQAAFISYLIALLFGFSSVDDYLILFLLFGYSFYLICDSKEKTLKRDSALAIPDFMQKYRNAILIFAILFLFWFIFFNFNLLTINNRINLLYYDYANGKYEKLLKDVESFNFSGSIMDNYSRERIIEIINKYIREENKDIKEEISLTRKIITLSQDNIIKSPSQLKYWLTAGEGINSLIGKKALIIPNFYKSQEMVTLIKEGNYYFDNASQLSPKRQEVYKEWAKFGIIAKDYSLAKEKADKCVSLDRYFGECYFLKALSLGYQKDKKGLDYNLILAKINNYDIDSELTLSVLINMQIENEEYNDAIKNCNKLILKTEAVEKKIEIYKVLVSAYKRVGNYSLAKNAEEMIKNLEK